MAISEEQARALAQAYQSGSPDLQNMVNSLGVTQADVNQHFPNFDVSGAGLSLAPTQEPVSNSPLNNYSNTSSNEVVNSPLNTSTSSPLGGSSNVAQSPTQTGGLPSNQLSGVVLAGDSWLANNALNTPYIQGQLGSTTVTNVAVGGSTSGDALNQLNNFISGGGTFAKGTTVVLDAGGNDLLQGISRDKITNNLNQISKTLGALGVNVVLSAAPNVDSVSNVTGSTTLGVDPLYQKVASANPNVTIVDAMSGLLNQKNLVDSSGFHMSDAGQMGYDTTLSNAVLKLQGKDPVAFSDNDIAQFVKDNNLTTEQAIALAPSFGLTGNKVSQALSTTPVQVGLSAINAQQTTGALPSTTTPVSSGGLSQPTAPTSADSLFHNASDEFKNTYDTIQTGKATIKNALVDDGEGNFVNQFGLRDASGNLITDYVKNLGNNIYQIPSSSTGGTMNTFVYVDPKTGLVNPVADPSKQVIYGGGNPGSWAKGVVRDLGPIPAIFATVTGNPELIPYINAASTAINGGNIGDIGKSFVLGNVA